MLNLKNLSNLNSILSIKQKKNFITLCLLMIFAMFLEILVLKCIYILLNSFTNNNINESSVIFTIIKKINFNFDINFFLIAVIFSAFFSRTILNLFINWKKGKFIFKTKEVLSEKFLNGYLYMPLQACEGTWKP